MLNSLPRILVLAGVVLIILGILAFLLKGKLGWLGHLPGDIRIERENFRFYFPITTMILLSVVLSLVLSLVRRFFS
jgi:uncharacterized membrane protein